MNAKGSVFKYPDNVDTDVIIPARHLNTQDAKELASHCMEDIDKDFVKNVKDGDIMVGGRNLPRACPAGHQDGGYFRRHRQELCPHLLPQQHQHRPAHHGVPGGCGRHQRRRHRERGL